MYHRNSDYALNKQDPDAIVCKSVTGVHTRLRYEDFSSEEEFQIWKDWSDADYHAAENADRPISDLSFSLNDFRDAPVLSAEELLLDHLEHLEQKAASDALAEQVKGLLTTKQYRRLCLYYLHGMSEAEIGRSEGVGQRRISTSLELGRKKVKNILKTFHKRGLK